MREWKSDPKPQPREKKPYKGLKRTPLKAKFSPTGERELFVKMYEAGHNKSWISGERLLPPTHEKFHWQYHHILEKGQNKYPKYKLVEKNIVPLTIREHDLIQNFRYKIESDPRWFKLYELEEKLKQQYPN